MSRKDDKSIINKKAYKNAIKKDIEYYAMKDAIKVLV